MISDGIVSGGTIREIIPTKIRVCITPRLTDDSIREGTGSEVLLSIRALKTILVPIFIGIYIIHSSYTTSNV